MTTAVGFGDFTRRQPDGRLNIVRAGAFTLARTREEDEVQVYPTGTTGPLSTFFNRTTTETWTVTLDSPSIQDNTLPYLFDQEVFTGTDIPIVIQTPITVPSTGPFTVTVTGLEEDQPVSSTLLRAIISPGDEYFEQIDFADVATIAQGQFAVSADTITYAAADAGTEHLINYRSTQASLDIIGGPAPRNPIGSFELFAKVEFLASPRTWNFWAPNATISADIEFGSEVDTISNEYALSGVPGWSYPWMMWQTPAT